MKKDNKLYLTIELGNCVSGISNISIVFSFDNARDMVNAKRILDVKIQELYLQRYREEIAQELSDCLEANGVHNTFTYTYGG